MKNKNALFECSNCGKELGALGQSHLENLPNGDQAWSCDKLQHTPTPWMEKQLNNENLIRTMLSAPNAAENADFIVRAVNAHEELVKIAKDYYYFLKSLPRTTDTVVTRMHVENVIARAEGK